MIKYPTCDMDYCHNDAQVYFEDNFMYVCQGCSIFINTYGSKVNLPFLSAAINAIEYSKYTLTQMKKFIMEFKEEANLQKIAPKVVEYKEELSQYLKEIKIIKRKNEWVKMIDMTEILQKFMKIIQDSEEMKQVSILVKIIVGERS
mmetsp:Transcript_2453/g.2111  ORF Transcript_2453/g.2111 Transcript_2453/m.2111 type:complete len:146 (-) Transcript_2453:288-725(-)